MLSKDSIPRLYFHNQYICNLWCLPEFTDEASSALEDPETPKEVSATVSPFKPPKTIRNDLDNIEIDPEDLEPLFRSKRNMYYDRGDPWGRDRIYGRKIKSRLGRKHSIGLGRKRIYGRRKQHRNYRGPGYGHDFESSSHKYTNTGYVDTSVIKPRSSSGKSNGGFVSARSSGVARVESTYGWKLDVDDRQWIRI